MASTVASAPLLPEASDADIRTKSGCYVSSSLFGNGCMTAFASMALALSSVMLCYRALIPNSRAAVDLEATGIVHGYLAPKSKFAHTRSSCITKDFLGRTTVKIHDECSPRSRWQYSVMSKTLVLDAQALSPGKYCLQVEGTDLKALPCTNGAESQQFELNCDTSANVCLGPIRSLKTGGCVEIDGWDLKLRTCDDSNPVQHERQLFALRDVIDTPLHAQVVAVMEDTIRRGHANVLMRVHVEEDRHAQVRFMYSDDGSARMVTATRGTRSLSLEIKDGSAEITAGVVDVFWAKATTCSNGKWTPEPLDSHQQHQFINLWSKSPFDSWEVMDGRREPAPAPSDKLLGLDNSAWGFYLKSCITSMP